MPPSLSVTLLALAGASGASSQHVPIPSTVPGSASNVVDRSFLGFGIECTSFSQYTANEFSQNMFSTFTNNTDAPLYIRVGGTSQDNSKFDPSQNTSIVETGKRDGLHTDITIGKPWIESFKKIDNAKYEVMIPLARKNISNGIEFLNASINAMGLENLGSIEIGNEPDLYGGADRNSSYTIAEYVDEWKAYAAAIEQQVQLPSRPIFRALDFAGSAWTAEQAFKHGLSPNSSRIQSVSHHYYQTTGGSSLQDNLLSQSFTERRTDAFKPSIAYLNTTAANIPFILGEVGSALGGGVKDYDLEASLGSAIWTANWMLYSMSINIARVQTQLLSGAPFSAWHAVANKGLNEQPGNQHNVTKSVLGSFYGNVMVRDFIASAEVLRVKQLPAPSKNVSAYAGYDGERLASVALFNQELWRASENSTRPAVDLTLQVPADTKSAKVQRLTGRGGGSQKALTWAGQRWSVESKGLPEVLRNNTEVLTPKNGTVEVKIGATEGVLVTLDC